MKCLDSLRPPVEDWQLVLYANGKALSESVLEKARSLTTHFTLLQTEEHFRPGKARNEALKVVEGEWVYFIDDDAFVLPGYWEVALPLLRDPKIQVLGGPDSPVKGMNALSTALALTLSSPFCTGGTFFRHKSQGKKLQAADELKLTSCNLWVKTSVLRDVFFPEDYIRAEETLFLQELKSHQLGMYYHPKLMVGHFRRSRLSQLFRPTFYAGFYRSRLMKEKLSKGNEVFWLPAIFVLLHFTLFLDYHTFFSLARLYIGMISFVSLALAMRKKKLWLFPHIAFLHYFIVFIYGVGFLTERLEMKK